MIIERNGIRYERLREDQIEEVRQWRNSAFVRQFMHYQDEISPDMQRQWFQKINNSENLYLIVYYKGEKIGLAHAKDISWVERSAEMGVFLIKKELIESPVPAIGALGLGELAFRIFRLEKLYARVRKDNARAIRFNKRMGFRLIEEFEDNNLAMQRFICNPGRFYQSSKKLYKAFEVLGFSNEGFRIELEPHDFETSFGEQMENIISSAEIPFETKKEKGQFIFTAKG